MSQHKDRKRDARKASPNVTEMLMELTEIHCRLLACFKHDATIERWDIEISDVMERIFQAIKEPD